MDNDEERLTQMMARMMATMTGSVSDMIRAAMAAQVDGLIDARKRLLNAGWEEWMVAEAIGHIIRGGTEAPRKAIAGLKQNPE